MTTPEAIAARLYAEYPEDAAQVALLALLSRPIPPSNPMGYCQRVAWRYLQREEWGKGRRAKFEVPLDLSTPPPLDAPQLERLLAREELSTLDPLDLARGFGDLDPEPQPGADPPRPVNHARRWREMIARRRKK